MSNSTQFAKDKDVLEKAVCSLSPEVLEIIKNLEWKSKEKEMFLAGFTYALRGKTSDSLRQTVSAAERMLGVDENVKEFIKWQKKRNAGWQNKKESSEEQVAATTTKQAELDQERLRRVKIQKAALRGIIKARDSVMDDWSKDLDRLEEALAKERKLRKTEALAKERKLRKTFESMLGAAGVSQKIITQVIREVCDGQ